VAAAEQAIATLLDHGAAAVLLGGGRLHDGARVIDRFDDGVTQEAFIHARLAVDSTGASDHLSAALAARLAQGLSCANACEAAVDHVARALQARHAAQLDSTPPHALAARGPA
jgi:hydroxymethylpyrimidine/phosphomethylpyrimidine kinase